MKFQKLALALTGLALSAVAPSVSFAQGQLFITGHDSDDHANGDYQKAGLDFLFFGAIATPAEAATRASKSIAYLGTSNASGNGAAASGYTNRTFIDISTNLASAFSGGYGALIIGTGQDYVSLTDSGLLNAAAASFATYFNGGGAIYVNSEQGLGQSFYNFLPSFGVSLNASIGDSGVFTPTAAGLAIGLTDEIVDADITHTTFGNVNNAFTIFETYDIDGSAVALGLRNAAIDNGGFVPGPNSPVPEPSTYGVIGALVLVGAIIARRKKAAASA